MPCEPGTAAASTEVRGPDVAHVDDERHFLPPFFLIGVTL